MIISLQTNEYKIVYISPVDDCDRFVLYYNVGKSCTKYRKGIKFAIASCLRYRAEDADAKWHFKYRVNRIIDRYRRKLKSC